MRSILIALFCFISLTGFSQRLPDFGQNKVRINLPDKSIVAEINPFGSVPKLKPSLSYYWYNAGAIHITESGYSGKLLNGLYTEYYPDKNLKQQGTFKKGLKDGTWKGWDENGKLIDISYWKKGRQVSLEKEPLWKRINLFKRKKAAESDTTKVSR